MSPTVGVRGIRGAITVERDEPAQILDATERLIRAIIERNELDSRDVASVLFTVTPDLRSEFPAAAARRIGWTLVPLLNFTEIGVPGRLERCIRVLVHVNTDVGQDEIEHVYLERAVTLRPDLVKPS
ncbi:MAG TPA: chorismate mutase [Candidatus Acidoferrum sp.]|jgi:chorismate mutase|nr:chorismate mutase [Candidatus Acidoferrum sp.]